MKHYRNFLNYSIMTTNTGSNFRDVTNLKTISKETFLLIILEELELCCFCFC